MNETKKIYEDKNLLADVFDAVFYDAQGNVVFISENLTSSDITGSADEKEVRNGRGNGLFAKLYSNKKIEVSLKTNAFDFSTIAMLAGTTVGTGKGTCYTPQLIQTVKEGSVILPYAPKYGEKVEIFCDKVLIEPTEYTFETNEIKFNEDSYDTKEIIIRPYEFDITEADEEDYKEITIRADQFPSAGKLVLKGVEKNQSAKDYRDLTIIIEKAQPSSDFTFSTSSEVDATETEIKLSALVENGRLMTVKEGKTIAKDNGTFDKIPVPELLEIPVTPATVGNLTVGGTQSLTSTVTGLTFDSSDKTVATVSATGKISALKVGTTNITISKAGYKNKVIKVTVVTA